MNKTILRTILGVVIGGFFLYLTLDKKPLDQIFTSISNARLNWVIISVICLLATFYIRAIRWKVLLESSDTQPGKYNVVHSLVLGYFVNSFTPKFGEIIRCTALKKSEQIPTSVSLGTVVSERIYDILILVSGLLIILSVEVNRLGNVVIGLKQSLAYTLNNSTLSAFLVILALAFIIFLAYRLAKKNKIAAGVAGFFRETGRSIKTSFKIKNYKRFVFLTVLIWIVLILVNYSFLMALPETENYSFYFAVMVLFVGGVGWALPSPGGIGTTNFMILQLFIAFSIDDKVGVSFGLLASGITFLVTVTFGALAILFHQIRKRYLQKAIL